MHEGRKDKNNHFQLIALAHLIDRPESKCFKKENTQAQTKQHAKTSGGALALSFPSHSIQILHRIRVIAAVISAILFG